MLGVTVFRRCLAAAALVATLGAAALAYGEPNCTCRYKGQSYALDTCVCLSTSDGPRMACCGLVLNNTSWKFTKNRCPVVDDTRSSPNQSFAARRETYRAGGELSIR